jgi:hypothetical protein
VPVLHAPQTNEEKNLRYQCSKSWRRHKAQSRGRDKLKKGGGTQLARTDFIWTNGFAEAAVSTDPCDNDIRRDERSGHRKSGASENARFGATLALYGHIGLAVPLYWDKTKKKKTALPCTRCIRQDFRVRRQRP